MRKKESWSLRSVVALIVSVTLVVVVLKEGKEQYQPYKIAEAQATHQQLANDKALREAYVKQLEQYFNDYKNVAAINELDMKKIRVMERYLADNGGTGGKLTGRANDFMNVCKFSEINLDPLLMWSISLHETGYGHSAAINNLNNVGGIFKGGKLHKYQSVYRGIVDMMLEIKYNGYYTNVTGLLSNNTTNTTIHQMGQIYCPVGATNDPTGLNQHWIPNVTEHYRNLKSMYEKEVGL